MNFKSALLKAAGLVLEIPPEAEVSDRPWSVMDDAPNPAKGPELKTVDQIVREQPGPNLDQIKVDATGLGPVSAPGGKVEFSQIYERAGLPSTQFGAEEALDVIHSLPVELPIQVKRATVQATLTAMGKAMGINTETVVADASRKLAALGAYGEALTHQTSQFISVSEAKISDLEKEIASHRATIEDSKSLLAAASASCTAEADRLDDVLEFFTMDVAPSKHAT